MIAYLKIIRPINIVLSAVGVSLGFWLTDVSAPLTDVVLLILTVTCAVGYGNVINDIKDAPGDRINHPDRPLPRGDVSPKGALIFAALLAPGALSASFLISPAHGIAAFIPLVLLTLYTLFLKGTPLLGNILISLLVAYTLIFGSIHSPDTAIIIIPAFCAFLLNFSREIIKDMQDRAGDLQTGLTTTAILPASILKAVLSGISVVYMLCFLLPVVVGHFHMIYLLNCISIILPLHIFWLVKLLRSTAPAHLETIATAIKIEMFAGLAALTVDKLVTVPVSFF